MSKTALAQKPKAELVEDLERKEKAAAKKKKEEKEGEETMLDLFSDVGGAVLGGQLLDGFEIVDGVSFAWFGGLGTLALGSKKVRRDPKLRALAHMGHGAFLGKVFEFSKENNIFLGFDLLNGLVGGGE